MRYSPKIGAYREPFGPFEGRESGQSTGVFVVGQRMAKTLAFGVVAIGEPFRWFLRELTLPGSQAVCSAFHAVPSACEPGGVSPRSGLPNDPLVWPLVATAPPPDYDSWLGAARCP